MGTHEYDLEDGNMEEEKEQGTYHEPGIEPNTEVINNTV